MGIKRSPLVWAWICVIAGMFVAVTVAMAFQGVSSPAAETVVWSTVFSDTFTTLSPMWSVRDFGTTGGQYLWGLTAYTRTAGTLTVSDTGLWAVGGGSVGRTQSWPDGTYVNGMMTWAIAGPFTLTQEVWEIRLRFRVDNRLASGDTLLVGVSGDGSNFDESRSVDAAEGWQEVVWSTTQFADAQAIWIGLRFQSDAQGVAAGPLVDDLRLEFNYGGKVYLPAVRRDPTSTPSPTLTPTATPTPQPQFLDQFDDPTSGWYVGPALRYNEWCRWGWDCHAGTEVVAEMSYDSSNYRMFVPMTWQGGGEVDTWYVWPAQAAPLPESAYPLPARYCLEVRGQIANSWEDYQPWWAHWGIVFAADDDMSELYTFQINANHTYSIFRIHNYDYPGNDQPLDGTEINVEIPIIPWGEDDLGALIQTAGYNTLRVVVKDSAVSVSVDGVYLDGIVIPDMPNNNVGVIGGSWEVTPVDLMLDYFLYDPLCPEVQ